ncbi:hypothetical protein [uncultured Halomonas sp.]|uniref:hypothetical protein n=1 Tax=uncultured Halomonas sp. TaxID=173971 RepID=UPI002629A191|nr:hypothetical protein [uncultured Halomonas sp.]
MAHLPMSQVVSTNEWGNPRIDSGSRNAKQFLTSQMYTDAVFNQDIRVIQTIINRIDGGLPKDTELEEYRTLFGDCMNDVLNMESNMQLKVMPDDTVMMALCKSLFDIATSDIYHEYKSDKHGNKWSKKVNPSTEKKQARDSALRLVLERAGGRKTVTPADQKKLADPVVADWIQAALPQKEGQDDDSEE